MQELCGSGDSSSDSRISQQSSEIMVLKAELESLKIKHKQLTDIHSRYKSQRKISVSIQTDDQVAM